MTRRDALKAIGHVALSTTAVGSLSACGNPQDVRPGAGPKDGGPAPAAGGGREPLKEVKLPNLHAYAQKSVFAGDTIDFRISSQHAYQMDIVRLGWSTHEPSRDWVIHRFDTVSNPVEQPIRPGSYVAVANALPADEPLTEMSLECWVRPHWAGNDVWQGLITQHTYPTACGFGLFLRSGEVVVYFGDGGTFNEAWLWSTGQALSAGKWHHLVATFSAGNVALWVDGQRIGPRGGFPQTVLPGSAPLRLAAYGTNGITDHTLDGDLAMPVIYSRALGAQEIEGRAAETPARPPTGPGVIGCWPFSEESGASVADVGPAGRHGSIVNHATWMIGGPGFTGPSDRLTRYNPQTDPTRGHGLRFASDDLYDCDWQITQSYTIPRDMPPGIYVARITCVGETCRPEWSRYDVTFVVRRPLDKPAHPILVLCSTNTWLAYNVPFPQNPTARDGWSVGGPGVTAPGAPSFNLYNDHPLGRPSYQVGVNVPWGIAAPYVRYLQESYDYSHLVRAERYLHVWLERNGYDFDIASDLDVHRDPNLLNRYPTVIVNGHSEYWSAPAYDGLQRYLEAGGNLFVGSGNTMFWRVSFDAEASVMECRKMPESVGGRPQAIPGELYHSHDGQRGGLLRECDRPQWPVTGLECVGYNTILFEPFQVRDAEHSLFRSPEHVAVSSGTPIGRNVGHEYDVRLTSIPVNLAPDDYRPAVPDDYRPVVLADRVQSKVEGDYFNYRGNDAKNRVNAPISEMIYYARPTGGRVVAAGSIATGRSIAEDPNMGAFMRNVLHEFGAAHRLNLFALDANHQLCTKWWNGTAWGPSLSTWDNLGGSFQDAPASVSFGGGRIAVMGVGADGRLAYKWWDGTTWQPSLSTFMDLGGTIQGRPRAVGWGGGRIDIFARGRSGEILNKRWDGNEWGPSLTEWQTLGGSGAGSPAAIAWHGNRLSVAALSATRSVIYKWWDGENWNPSLSTWTDMGGKMQFGPTMFSWGGNRINILAVDDNGQLLNKSWDGQNWGPSLTEWEGLGGALASPPVVAVREGDAFTIFARWQDGTIRAKWWDGMNWGPSRTEWQNLGGNFVDAPAAVAWRGGWVGLAAMTADEHVQYKWWDGVNWNPSETTWQDMGQGLKAGVTALAWIGDR